MTDRDEFAKAALIGFTNSLRPGLIYDLDLVAKQAYEIADAMLRQQEKCQVSSQENLTLTAAEREAAMTIISCGEQSDDVGDQHAAATLRGLLERLGGER